MYDPGRMKWEGALINELTGFSVPTDILTISHVIISVCYAGVPIRFHFIQKVFLF